jgi:Putative collagen-binding domain of a collagenase
MGHLRRLLESRPFLDRVPDQRLLLSNADTGTNHIRATRARDGSYALIYSAAGLPFTLDASRLTGPTLTVHWYDPRSGTAQSDESVTTGSGRTFNPPTHGEGQDWVLVLDDADRNFPLPGA